MQLPHPRGPIGERLDRVLTRAPGTGGLAALDDAVTTVLAAGADPLDDDDLQLSLLVLYELHYRGFDGVDDRWEWHPGLVAARTRLEGRFEARLRDLVDVPEVDASDPRAVASAVFELAAADDGPDLARFVARKAGARQARELLVLKSIYQLKEADPHTWAIPRLRGRAKVGLVEVQADEYGDGDPERMHAALFARPMRAAGLDRSSAPTSTRSPRLSSPPSTR